MAEFKKGDRVRIISGEGEGVEGEVFWWGKSKFGDNMRAGVVGDNDGKYWVDDSDLVAAEAVVAEPEVASGNHLEGLKIVLTGDFQSYKRSQASKVLEDLGADVTSAVSGKTTFVIAGTKPGAKKLSKAEEKGLPILDEAQMLEMIGGKTFAEVFGPENEAPEPPKPAAKKTTKKKEPKAESGNHLEGLKIVLTGDFDLGKRTQVSKMLEALGADVTGSVSGKTKLVIAGKKPGATKMNKAKKNGLPIFNEGQLQALLEGKTFEQVLEDVPKEPESATSPLPPIRTYPRDGEYIETFDGSDQVKISGQFKDGLKTGSWKEFWPSGQLKNDYHWEKGLQHGQEWDWSESGHQVCEGQLEHGKRVGKWTWFYDDGKFYNSRNYINGKQEGDYLWLDEEGGKRAVGAYLDDKMHGPWEWWNEPNHEHYLRGYYRGQKHGEEAAWYPGGQLAFRLSYVYGFKHGHEEQFGEDGKPRFTGEWSYGNAVGTHHTWDDDGNETTETFIEGLPEDVYNDTKLVEKIVKKLKKAKDQYKKQDAIGDQVEYGQREAMTAFLWRHGHYDVSKDPDLWGGLSYAGLYTGEDLLAFLKTAKTRYKGEYGMTDAYTEHLPYWARDLDEFAMAVYARDPEPIDAGWRDLPDPMKKGMAFVLARWGKDVGDVLDDEMGTLIKKHVENYRLGARVKWPIDGHIEEKHIFYDTHDEGKYGEPTEHFDEFISIFGTREQWIDALRDRAKEEIDFDVFFDLVQRADIDELIKLVKQSNPYSPVIKKLVARRNDSAEDLMRIAIEAYPDDPSHQKKWPFVVHAIIKFAEEGKEIPDELVQRLPLMNESSTSSSGWYTDPVRQHPDAGNPAVIAAHIPITPGCCRYQREEYYDALNVLNEDQIRIAVNNTLEEKYSKHGVASAMYRIKDEDLWKQTITLLEEYEYGNDTRCTFGIGDIGLDAMPLLEDALKRAKGKKKKEGWWQAIINCLAIALDAGHEVPKKYDTHVRVDGMKDAYYYKFLVPFIQRIVFRLPVERAEAIVLQALDANFWRAFELVPCCATETVIKKAMPMFLEHEASMDYEFEAATTRVFKALPNTRAWVEWVIQSGGGSAKNALSSAVGWKVFEEIEKAAAEGGLEAAKPKDTIDKIKDLVEGKGGETMYFFRRIDETDASDLNVIGGAAPGIDSERWPVGEEPMTHLYTVDLKTVPEIAKRFGDFRTMSVFCESPDYNEAWEPGNGFTAVIFSTQAQIDAGGDAPDDVEEMSRARFDVIELQVDMSDEEVRNRVYQAPARAGGDPIWLQDEAGWGDFIMQFDESFVYMNLGDMGVMYVYSDDAFWQCH